MLPQQADMAVGQKGAKGEGYENAATARAADRQQRQGQGNSLGNALALDDALAVLEVDGGLALTQAVEGVDLGDDGAGDARGPEAVGRGLQAGGGGVLADAGGVEDGGGVKGQVARVSELASHGRVAQELVGGGAGGRGLGVEGDGGGLEVLNRLAEAEKLAQQAKLLLGGGPGRDGLLGRVGAQQVPGVEAGEILHGAVELVAAERGREELEQVGHAGVVDNGVGDHGGGGGAGGRVETVEFVKLELAGANARVYTRC